MQPKTGHHMKHFLPLITLIYIIFNFKLETGGLAAIVIQNDNMNLDICMLSEHVK